MRTSLLLAFSLLVPAGALLAQQAPPSHPEFRVLLAADPQAAGPQGLVWLRTRFLPAQPNWPAGTDPLGPLLVEASAHGLTAARMEAGDDRFYLAGEVQLDGAHRMLVACTSDGTEDWFVPSPAKMPAYAGQFVQTLGPVPEAHLRALDLAAACGLLAKGMVEQDPRLPLATLGAAHCGEVTWAWWRNERELRVRGKSNGGLLLPALALHAANSANTHRTAGAAETRHASLQLHALAGRDVSRNESIRQLVRSVPARSTEDLGSLLHTDGTTKHYAMDALARMGDPTHLEAILAAMDPADPVSTSLAASALHELLPTAPREVRASVENQLQDLPQPLREDLLRNGPAAWQVRAAVALSLVLLGLFGFWMRERTRLQQPH